MAVLEVVDRCSSAVGRAGGVDVSWSQHNSIPGLDCFQLPCFDRMSALDEEIDPKKEDSIADE